MEWIKIETAENRTFLPGERVPGTVSWELAEDPASVELRLFWYTAGKGDQDIGVVETVPFDGPGARDRRTFEVRLPWEPYSFSGTLISLIWALEAVVEPGARAERLLLIVSPSGSEILLSAAPQPVATR